MRPTASILVLFALGCTEYDLSRPDKEDPTPVDTSPPEPTVAPDIVVTPTSLEFGVILRECPSEPQTVTVENVGDAELIVGSVSLQGSGSSAFRLDGQPINLQPNESFTFDVTFTPTAWTRFEVDVVVVSNDPDEPEVAVGLMGDGGEDQTFEDTFVQEYFDEVDVLWVVDNSGSMSSAIAQVQNNFSHFIGQFLDLGLDYHIGVVTTDMDNPAMQGQLQGPATYIDASNPDPEAAFLVAVDQGSNGSGSERGFEATRAALTEPLISGHNAGFLRESAALATIVVSDEDDDSNILPSNFASWYNGLKSDPSTVTFSAICGDPGFTGCLDPFGTGVTATPGNLYVDAVDRTGGIWQSICTANFDTALRHLSVTAAGMSYEFSLTRTPSSLATMVVTVNGTEVPYALNDGWIYNSDNNSVVFDGEAIPDPGAEIVVTYPVSGECL
ncbi:MAG: choice-of-anchor D domain-containing protein [Alphaproteobacteria bacterium]|nr:choice-of-anchor D domain-containing protein [Alphaproteobacteria bacterium]